MAQFTNQAQLSYNGTVITSNIAVGEIMEVLSASKTAVTDTYRRSDRIAYVISIRNTGETALTGLTATDDLGAGAATPDRAPLQFLEDSVLIYINGALQTDAPAVSPGPPLVISGLSIPAQSNLLIVYEAVVTPYAPLDENGSITNTVTVTGGGLSSPATAEETVTALSAPDLTITKSIDPVPVAENGRVTYTFLIRNYGNTPVVATDDAVITDLFDPILSDLTVSYNGTSWTEGIYYTYDEASGAFATLPGQIVVPAASFSIDPESGAVVTTPGFSTLTVVGTI